MMDERKAREIPKLDPPGEEITLDPEDWSGMRRLAHRMVDEMMTYMENSSQRPTWRRIPDQVKRTFQDAVPRQGQDAAEVYEEFVENVLPYPYGNIHPRFWGWVCGTGTPLGAMAEMLAATLNPNVGGFEQSAVYVEQQVIDWFRELLGFPDTASGILVSGGSMANLLGLTVARYARAGFEVRREGLQGDHPRLMIYASSETHLVRSREDHRAAFQLVPEYLKPLGGGLPSGGTMFSDYGIELSRSFRALKVWMSIKTHGLERYSQLIEQNVKQARHIAARVEAHPRLELMAPVSLNVACLRYRISGRTTEELNELNRRILIALHEDGIAVPSMTELGGQSSMRVAITNHRTRSEDLDLLVTEVVRLGDEFARRNRDSHSPDTLSTHVSTSSPRVSSDPRASMEH